jgi:hypothetical protein
LNAQRSKTQTSVTEGILREREDGRERTLVDEAPRRRRLRGHPGAALATARALGAGAGEDQRMQRRRDEDRDESVAAGAGPGRR